MRVLYFDYPSLPSAIAVVRAQRAVERHGPGGLAFGGFDVLGLDAPVPVTLEQLDDIDAWRADAARVGIDVRRPSDRPATTGAHVLGDLADEHGCGAAWRHLLIDGYWCRGWRLSDHGVLLAAAEQVGITADEASAALEDRNRLQRVRSRMVAARRRGVGGVPVLEIDGTLVAASLDDEQWTEIISGW
jgi:predicted DsbA family dithiol-disulfide isomerase